MLARFLSVALAISFSIVSFAQTPLPEKKSEISKKKKKTKKKRKKKARRPTIKSKTGFNVKYGSSSWNQNSTTIDSATLLIKDSVSGKMAQIELEESAPDSSNFSGSFNVNWGQDKVAPQVFIPPQNLRGDENWVRKTNQLIKEGKLKRKPFLIKKGIKTMEVYDSRAQAKEALKVYRQELSAKRAHKLKKKPTDKDPIAAEALFEAAKLAEMEALKKKLALEAARRAAERIRLAQIEKQKETERLKKQRALSKAERERRKKRAAELARKALALFYKNKYKESADLFEESMNLDPSNKSYSYQYGTVLFRLKEYNKAIVIFKQSNHTDNVERDYYIGLSYYYLKELNNSYNIFNQIKQTKHKTLAPSAAFYLGLIRFGELKYEEAKPHFEWVLDHSQDPKLDQQAENYIEQIAGIMFFAEQAKIKYFLNITTGLTYDSNVLSTSDSTIDAGTASNVGGARALAIVGGKYRPIYNKSHELTTDLDLIYFYSFNSVHATADPLIVTASVPYVHKRVLFGKGYQTTIKAGYEQLYLDALATGNRDKIMNSMLLDWSNNFVMTGTWFSAYSLNIRMDDSLLSTSTGNDDSDTTKIKVGTSQTFILNKAKSKMLIGDVSVTSNGAKGRDQEFFRYDLGISHIRPAFWEMNWTSSFKYYSSNYSNSTTGRKDTNHVISSGLSKIFNKIYSGSITADYTKNNSTVDANEYTKWTILSTFSAAYSF